MVILFQAQSRSVGVVIGNASKTCRSGDEICNGPLNPNTAYEFKYRLYTTNDDSQYIESDYSPSFRTCEEGERERERERERPSLSSPTAPTDNSPVIAGAVVGVVIAALVITIIIVIIVVVVCRRKYKKGEYAFM